MKNLANRTLLLSIVALLLMLPSYSQQIAATSKSATDTLRHYVELRLHWANWQQYSQFITWPDEPSWDCWWVATDHSISAPVGNGDRVVIPVTYQRLGLYCADFQFQFKSTTDTVRYELLRKNGVWRIDGPVPDYPYLQWQVLADWLAKISTDKEEPTERNEQARTALATLTSAVGAGKCR